MRGDQRVVQFTEDSDKFLRSCLCVDEYIKVGIGRSIAKEMVVSWVGNLNQDKTPVLAKFVQEINSTFILHVHICIPPYEQQSIRILFSHLLDAVIKLGKLFNELGVLTGSRQVDRDMDGGRSLWEREN